MVNPEKALEDSKPMRVKDEPMSDIAFPVSEEPEADLASGDQALPIGVLGTSSERMGSGLDAENSPHVSGNNLLNMKHLTWFQIHCIFLLLGNTDCSLAKARDKL